MTEDPIILIKKDIDDLLEAKRIFQTGTSVNKADSVGDDGLQYLDCMLDLAADKAQLDMNRISVYSRRPLVGFAITYIKRIVRKSTYWLYQPLFSQVSLFNSSILDVVNKIALNFNNLNAHLDEHIKRKFEDRINSLEQNLDIRLERKLQDNLISMNQYMQDVKQELKRLRCLVKDWRSEAVFLRAKLAVTIQEIRTAKLLAQDSSVPSAEIANSKELFGDADWLYHIFEQQFRGTELMIRERQQAYIAEIQDAFISNNGYVLDVGSGRGEFLELCREANIPAKGVDLNELMINRCREKGLSVERADGLEHLKSIPDESLCALTAFQVIEHLSPEQIRQLIQAALIKLKPGGVIILETVNPDYLFAFKYFSIDLTHQRPIHSLTLQFLLEAAGFRNLEVRLSGLVEDEIKIMQEGDSKENSLLVHGYLDYAVVGWR